MLHRAFAKFASKCADAVGSPWATIAAGVLIVAWAASGPFFGFSDTWELIINTATTIITFLMVFLIQNTQNRDAKALHLKLDELICAIDRADDHMIDVENLEPERLAELAKHYSEKRAKYEALHAQRTSGVEPTLEVKRHHHRRSRSGLSDGSGSGLVTESPS